MNLNLKYPQNYLNNNVNNNVGICWIPIKFNNNVKVK